MPITAVPGKSCTLTIGGTSYTAWVTNLTTSGDKAGDTVATWGEDVAYAGNPSYTASASFVFDPNDSSFGAAMEDAFDTQTPVTLTVAYGTASRVFTNWLVTGYSDDAPAEGLVTCQVELTGDMWATTYAV